MAKVMVVGANRGIGLELCRQLKARGDAVIGTCRSASPALASLGVRVESGVDVTDDASVKALAARIAGEALDVLVINAGVLDNVSLSALDVDSIRRQFEVNAIGPLRVAAALLPNLHRGSKLAIVTSRMGSIADNGSGGHYGYRMSKAAANMAGVSLAHDLRPGGVAVVMLHPGFVRTDLTHGRGDCDPPVAARGLIERIDRLSLEDTGTFVHANGERLAW